MPRPTQTWGEAIAVPPNFISSVYLMRPYMAVTVPTVAVFRKAQGEHLHTTHELAPTVRSLSVVVSAVIPFNAFNINHYIRFFTACQPEKAIFEKVLSQLFFNKPVKLVQIGYPVLLSEIGILACSVYEH